MKINYRLEIHSTVLLVQSPLSYRTIDYDVWAKTIAKRGYKVSNNSKSILVEGKYGKYRIFKGSRKILIYSGHPKLALNELSQILEYYDLDDFIRTMRFVSITALLVPNEEMQINIEKAAEILNEKYKCIYDPEYFVSAIICDFPEANIKLFSNGKILVLGIPDFMFLFRLPRFLGIDEIITNSSSVVKGNVASSS